ncbi:Vacuolar ATP synthase subunit B [Coemansia furcata]|nr:Vacuolar ATP synthase subunit B [Coemansia furcata]
MFKLILNESDAATVKVDTGEEELLPDDNLSLEFLEKFEGSFIAKGAYKNCTIYDSLELAWSLLLNFPKEMLNRILKKVTQEFYAGRKSLVARPSWT